VRAAIACIPDCYLRLSLESDGWYYFLAAVAVVIRVMQAFERAVLWPLHRILETLYYSHSRDLEYFSASCLFSLPAWIYLGRQDYLREWMTSKCPPEVWVGMALALGIGQTVAAARGTYSTRSATCMFACAWWCWVSYVVFYRIGFSLDNVFGFWLAFAFFLKALGLARRVHHGPAEPRI